MDGDGMIDYRIYTFLNLCETMNYRKTSEKLNISQPAVTQHIHALEQEYDEKLFYYAGRVLHKTKAAEQLEEYSKTMLFYENELRTSLKGKSEIMLRIGATKTIGEFVLEKQLIQYLSEPTHNRNLSSTTPRCCWPCWSEISWILPSWRGFSRKRSMATPPIPCTGKSRSWGCVQWTIPLRERTSLFPLF